MFVEASMISVLLSAAAAGAGSSQAYLSEQLGIQGSYQPALQLNSPLQTSIIPVVTDSFNEEFYSFFSSLLRKQKSLPEDAAAILEDYFWDLC